VYWPNGWVPDFPRRPFLSFSGRRGGIVPLQISNGGVADCVNRRRQPARPSSGPLTGCSHFVLMARGVSRRDSLPPFEKSEAETTALAELEVDEAIATCGGDVRAALRATLIANAYLEAEIERLIEAISTGFARGRMRKAPQRITKI
jgi:hypothetical protein